ncbi:uncharacterized protein [Cherax quadricarinatus]
MTLRRSFPSYVVREDFKTHEFVTYAGQRKMYRLCGAFDHMATGCGKAAAPRSKEMPVATESLVALSSAAVVAAGKGNWADEVDGVEEHCVTLPEASVASPQEEPEVKQQPVGVGEVGDLQEISEPLQEMIKSFLDMPAEENPALDGGLLMVDLTGQATGSPGSGSGMLQLLQVDAEVHRESGNNDMEIEGASRKRAGGLSDDEVITPAQRPGKKTSYIITTPRQWVSGATAQVCVYVDNPSAPDGKLTFAVKTYDWQPVDEDRNFTVVPNTVVHIPGGKTEKCYEVAVPSSTYNYGDLHIFGSVAGVNISRTVSMSWKRSKQVTFIQTDKYLYEPSENVKFRILTVTGPYLNVSTDQGLYTIYVDTQEESHSTTNFKVEDFVLPRFEVTLKPPSYILATDETFTFTVCANMAQASRRRINTVCVELIRGAVTGTSMDLILPAIIRDTYGIADEEIYGVALNGTTRIFVKFNLASVYEAVVDKYQEVTLTVNSAVTVRLHDVSRHYTWVKIRNVPFEADDSDIRLAMGKYGTVHMATVGKWATGPYAGKLEGTYSVKMTLRYPIPSYVVLPEFRTQVFVTYAGQRRTCRLCGSYDHLAALCERRRGNMEQRQRHTAIEKSEDLPYVTLPTQGGSWSEEVERAEEMESAGVTRGGDTPSLNAAQVLEEDTPTASASDVEDSLAMALNVLLADKSIGKVGSPDLVLGSVVDPGVEQDLRSAQCDKNILMQAVEVEVHRDNVSDDMMQAEGASRKRAAALSDSEDVITPAQRTGKKSWAEVTQRGHSGPKGQELVKSVSKGGERDRGVTKRSGGKTVPGSRRKTTL